MKKPGGGANFRDNLKKVEKKDILEELKLAGKEEKEKPEWGKKAEAEAAPAEAAAAAEPAPAAEE